MVMHQEVICETNKAPTTEQRRSLPIFAYGTLQGEGMRVNTDSHALSIGRFVTRGVRRGLGDKYPCADITFDMVDITSGEGLVLSDKSQEALYRIDEYEGVDDGYYQRRIIFALAEDSHDLFTPMWVYVRGEKLEIE